MKSYGTANSVLLQLTDFLNQTVLLLKTEVYQYSTHPFNKNIVKVHHGIGSLHVKPLLSPIATGTKSLK